MGDCAASSRVKIPTAAMDSTNCTSRVTSVAFFSVALDGILMMAKVVVVVVMVVAAAVVMVAKTGFQEAPCSSVRKLGCV